MIRDLEISSLFLLVFKFQKINKTVEFGVRSLETTINVFACIQNFIILVNQGDIR
jgi:hypothetical protein